MKKVVFVDIDGTIYSSHQDSISESIKSKLKEVHNDIDLYISTGRGSMALTCLREAKQYFKGFVVSNGAVVINNNQIITKKIIEKNDLKQLIKHAKDLGCNIGLLTLDKVYVVNMNEIVNYALTPRDDNSIVNMNGYDFDLDLEYNMVWSFDEVTLIDELEKRVPKSFTFFRWGKIGCDIVSNNITKKKGIEELLSYLNIDISNTYAIGDSGNDIPMFSLVKTSICMGNGTEQAKMAATYITKDLNEGGFEEAIDKIMKGIW